MTTPNEYAFLTRWNVPGDIHTVATILEDIESLPRWWPAVYLDVRTLEPGGPGGVGKLVALHTTGWLPYTLRWRLRVIASRSPYGFSIAADGDLVGRGEWTLEAAGDVVRVVYDWRVRADKPLVRRFSWALRPLFAANHRWAMARGRDSLGLEVQRRRAPDAAARALVPAPPGPTWYSRRRRAR
jgi:hypothetical protein